MSEDDTTGKNERNRQPREPDRRAIDAIFGDVLPETTSDERDDRDSGRGGSDDWYLENRPPHHDR